MKRLWITALTVVLLALSTIQSSMAAEHDRGRDRHEPWHGDIRAFHEHDLSRWRAGRWFHGAHGGRRGWWWIVGGGWYFYPAPAYPYPDPYQPSMAGVPPDPNLAPPQYWYYCASPAGYYPYVPQCAANWQPVPAAAPLAQSAPSAPAAPPEPPPPGR